MKKVIMLLGLKKEFENRKRIIVGNEIETMQGAIEAKNFEGGKMNVKKKDGMK